MKASISEANLSHILKEDTLPLLLQAPDKNANPAFMVITWILRANQMRRIHHGKSRLRRARKARSKRGMNSRLVKEKQQHLCSAISVADGGYYQKEAR